MNSDQNGLGLTRWRDLAVVALVAALAGYLLLRWNYHRWPPLPRLAGLPAGLIGIGEGIAAWGMRRRLTGHGEPPAPLVAARTVALAKASALAAAAFGGFWIGELAHVVPLAGEVAAAAGDRTTGFVGLIGAAVMLAGALLLERSLRTPPDPDPPPPAV